MINLRILILLNMLKDRKLLSLICLSIVTLTVLLGQSKGSSVPDPYEELETQASSPEGTYELIKVLQLYYKNRTDVRSNLRKNKLNDLIWVKELNKVKCSSSSWNKYLNIIEKFDDQKLSLLPFLLKAKDDLAEYCVNSTRNWYSSDLKTIRELDKKLLGDSKDDPLKADEVYKSLNDLQALIADFTHKTYVKKKEDIRNLLDISQLDIDKCTSETLIQFNDLLDQYDTNNQTSGLQSYVLAWKGKHEEYCREWEAEKVKIANMTDGNAIYSTLFGENAVPAKNQTIREMLSRLADLIELDNNWHSNYNYRYNQWYQDDYSRSNRFNLGLSIRKKEGVERLNLFGNQTDKLCDLSSWNEFLVLLERNKQHKINIVPYLMYMKQKRANFCRSRVLSGYNYFDSDPLDWEYSYNLVFSPASPQLTPASTLSHLEHLQRLFSKRVDKGSIRRRVIVRNLLRVKPRDVVEKCKLAFWFELMSMYDAYRNQANNVLLYLNDTRNAMESDCRYRWPNQINLYKLFMDKENLFTDSEESEQMKLQEIHDELRSLKDKFMKIEEPKFTHLFTSIFNELLELGDLNKDKCKEEAFEHFDDLIYKHSSSSVNILPYIEYWRKKQMNFCVQEFDYLIRQ